MLKNDITYESLEQFTEKVKCTLYVVSAIVADNIILSINKHLNLSLISINLPAFYHEFFSLIGYATHYM